MNFKNPYWTKQTKMELLERWILVHSIIYYRLNTSIVSDEMFDKNCMQLVQMAEDYPKEFKQTSFYYCFFDFDGSTGFDLYGRLKSEDSNYLESIAFHLVKRYGNKGG